MKSYEKKVLSKIVLSIPTTVLELLQSKDECKTTFNLNKYVFFTAVVYSTGIGNEINSTDLYKFLGLNNLDGGKLKKDLINWNIIKEAYCASYKKQKDGKFTANNSAYYEVNLDYVFKPKVNYTLYSDRAKYINKLSLFDYLNVIVEKVENKELKKIRENINMKRREKYKPLVKPVIMVVSTPVNTITEQPDDFEGYTFIGEEKFIGYDDEFIFAVKLRMVRTSWNFKHKGLVEIGFKKDVANRIIEIKKVG